MWPGLRHRAIRQSDLQADDEGRIRALLVAAFPQHATRFSCQSYWGSVPDWRLMLENEEGRLLAHAGFGFRDIAVGDGCPAVFCIAGVGAVCVDPTHQGSGLGVLLFDRLRAWLGDYAAVDFALLECGEAIVPFHEAAGFARMQQVVWCLDPDSGSWQDSVGPKMVMPIGRPLIAWPATGRIDLRGMPW
jgi:GNAT superfamily N-acetyltransferase